VAVRISWWLVCVVHPHPTKLNQRNVKNRDLANQRNVKNRDLANQRNVKNRDLANLNLHKNLHLSLYLDLHRVLLSRLRCLLLVCAHYARVVCLCIVCVCVYVYDARLGLKFERGFGEFAS